MTKVVPAKTARELATRVLVRVVTDGAYASLSLDAEQKRSNLDPRDARLATELVYGTLRTIPSLDRAIAAHTNRPLRNLDAFVHSALRVAAYQILYLSRVPAHAAVSETVTLVTRESGKFVGGFVNAVLRKVATMRPENPQMTTALEVPTWFSDELKYALGEERAARFLGVRGEGPALSIRVETDRISRDDFRAKLEAAMPEIEVTPMQLSQRGLFVRGGGDLREWPFYADGLFTAQDEGSQILGELAGAKPGEVVLDLCAGHGGKTFVLAKEVGEKGRVFAVDRYEEKLERLAVEAKRLGIAEGRIETRALDLQVGTGDLKKADRVIVDAPCTGLGTVFRRPEILLRAKAGDAVRMSKVQKEILETAQRLVHVGGTLLYSVCSPMRAEGIDVVKAFGKAHPNFALAPFAPMPNGLKSDDDGILRLGPFSVAEGAGPEGYQLARWIRKG